jgi:CheY-like chemotaxis protein
MDSKFQLFAVDDNRGTILDIKQAAAKKNLPEVKEAVSEEEGLELVSRFRKATIPPVFIVDLQLRDDESGFRILQAIREKPSLRFAPVIILTSTGDQETINRSYELGATAYVVKEDDPNEFARVLDDLISYWGDISMHEQMSLRERRAS